MARRSIFHSSEELLTFDALAVLFQGVSITLANGTHACAERRTPDGSTSWRENTSIGVVVSDGLGRFAHNTDGSFRRTASKHLLFLSSGFFF